MIVDQIKFDLSKARRLKDTSSVSMISTVLDAVQAFGKASGNRVTTDEEAISICRKTKASNTDAIKLVGSKGGSTVKYETENAYIAKFIPDNIPLEVIESEVDSMIAELDTASMKDMGSIISRLKSKFKSNFDARAVSGMIKSKLV